MASRAVLLFALCNGAGCSVASPTAAGGPQQAAAGTEGGRRAATGQHSKWTPEPFINKYAGPYMPRIRDATDGQEWRDDFMHWDAVELLASQAVRPGGDSPAIPRRAGDCRTLGALKEWRDIQLEHIETFVPETFRPLARRSLHEEFERNKARIQAEERAAESRAERPAAPVAPAEAPAAPVALVQGGAEEGADISPEIYLKRYAGPRVPRIHNVSAGQEWRDDFMGRSAEAYALYAGEMERIGQEFEAAPRRASNCHTPQELRQWRDAQLARIQAFVPRAYRHFAERDLDKKFEREQARISAERAAKEARAAEARAQEAAKAQAKKPAKEAKAQPGARAGEADREPERSNATGAKAPPTELLAEAPAGEDAATASSPWDRWVPDAMPAPGSPPEKWINRFAGPNVPKIHNASDGQEWRDNFMHGSAGAFLKFAEESERLAHEFPNAPQHARDCHTLKALKGWRDAKLAQIKAFVPEAFQKLAARDVDGEFQRQEGRIEAEEAAAEAARAAQATASKAGEPAAKTSGSAAAPAAASGTDAGGPDAAPEPAPALGLAELPDSEAAPSSGFAQYASQWMPPFVPEAGREAKRYIDKYAGAGAPHILNASDAQEWRDHFMRKFAKAYAHYADDRDRLDREFAGAPGHARSAQSIGALKEWRKSQAARIRAFVPEALQKLAEDTLQAEYDSNKARIKRETAERERAAREAAEPAGAASSTAGQHGAAARGDASLSLGAAAGGSASRLALLLLPALLVTAGVLLEPVRRWRQRRSGDMSSYLLQP